MHTAATGGISGSALGRRAFWQSDATLPGVSLPSSVVRSTIETAVFRPQTFDPFLMLRVVNFATRSSIPTWSTVPISSNSLVKLERIVAVVAMLLLILCADRGITSLLSHHGRRTPVRRPLRSRRHAHRLHRATPGVDAPHF